MFPDIEKSIKLLVAEAKRTNTTCISMIGNQTCEVTPNKNGSVDIKLYNRLWGRGNLAYVASSL